MSDTLLLRLPRFDAPLTAVAFFGDGAVDDRSAASAGAQRACNAGEEASCTPGSSVSGDSGAPDAALQAAVDAAVSGLADAVLDMRKDNAARLNAAIGTIASSLFPKLSKLFLADELARHLPGLIPAGFEAVEVRASPMLAKMIERAANGIAGSTITVSVCPDERLRAGEVQVNWQSGGLDFDFDALLGSCLAQFNATQPDTRT